MRSTPSKTAAAHAAALETAGGPARAGIVAAEFFDEQFVSVDYPDAALDLRFGWEPFTALAGALEKRGLRVVMFYVPYSLLVELRRGWNHGRGIASMKSGGGYSRDAAEGRCFIDMKTHTLTVPQIGLIGGTRAALGAGVALLLAEKMGADQRRAVGWALLAVGVLTTIPLVMEVLSDRE